MKIALPSYPVALPSYLLLLFFFFFFFFFLLPTTVTGAKVAGRNMSWILSF